jgi:hypothetical protein
MSNFLINNTTKVDELYLALYSTFYPRMHHPLYLMVISFQRLQVIPFTICRKDMSTNLGKEVLTSLKNPQRIAQGKHSQDAHCKNTIHALHSSTTLQHANTSHCHTKAFTCIKNTHTNLKKNFEKTITTSNHHRFFPLTTFTHPNPPTTKNLVTFALKHAISFLSL